METASDELERCHGREAVWTKRMVASSSFLPVERGGIVASACPEIRVERLGKQARARRGFPVRTSRSAIGGEGKAD